MFKNRHLQVKIANDKDTPDTNDSPIPPWMTADQANDFARSLAKGVVCSTAVIMGVYFAGHIAQDTIGKTVEHLLNK